MDIPNYHNLFSQILGIVERYKNIDYITGENFNVFRILKMESAEVRMHSALIAELLDPKGSHGQKDAFLRLFIPIVCFKNYDIDTQSCTVRVEKHTGYITDDRLKGGRLDIIISDQYNKHIIIENKIYAGDQENQLIRYHAYSNDANLLYLTLDGRLPAMDSHKQLIPDQDFKCISYDKNIISWLEECRKEAVSLPILRETITQYINLIKYLTNQTLNQSMQEDINYVISKNIKASILVADNLKNTQAKILQDFGLLLHDEIAKRGLKLRYTVDLKTKFNGFYVYKPEWSELQITFQFQPIDRDLVYGIAAIGDAKINPISTARRLLVTNLPNNSEQDNIYWPWIRKMEEPYDNWHSHDTWEAILSGKILANVLSKVDVLLEYIGETDL